MLMDTNTMKNTAQRQASDQIRMHDRHIRAWQLKAQGFTNEEIGVRLAKHGHKPLSTSSVTRILAEAEQRFDREQLIPAIQSVKARQIAQLEYTISEAFTAWRKSKTPGQSATRHVASRVLPQGTPGAPVKGTIAVAENVSEHASEREGNPKYLEAAMAAMDRIRRITGADAPQDFRFGMGANSATNDVPFDTLDDSGVGNYLGELGQVALLLAPPQDEQIIDLSPLNQATLERFTSAPESDE